MEPTRQTSSRRRRMPWPVGALLMLVGAALVVPFVARFAATFTELAATPVHATPGDFSVELGQGRYIIFERTATSTTSDDFSVGEGGPVSLRPAAVQVTSPEGQRVPVRQVAPDETSTRGSSVYTAAVAFDSPSPGWYDIHVGTDGRGEVLVERSVVDIFRGFGLPFLLALLGGFLLLVGGVLLFVRLLAGP